MMQDIDQLGMSELPAFLCRMRPQQVIDLLPYCHHVADLPVQIKGILEYVPPQGLLLMYHLSVIKLRNTELRPLWHIRRMRMKVRRSGCGCGWGWGCASCASCGCSGCSASAISAGCRCEGWGICHTPLHIRKMHHPLGAVGWFNCSGNPCHYGLVLGTTTGQSWSWW